MVHNSILTRQAAVTAGIITAVASILGTYIYQKLKKPRVPKEWRVVGEVKRVCIFKLKSGKRIEVDTAECSARGLIEMEKPDKSLRLQDRSFVVYHKDNFEYRNARNYPKMVLIELKAIDMKSVVINAPGMRLLVFPLSDTINNKQVMVKHVLDEKVRCFDCGDEVAEWISQYILGKDSGLRLAYNDGSYKRVEFEEAFKSFIEFYKRGLRNESVGLNSDVTALHMINLASVVDVTSRIENSEVTANDFRPNLLIDGPNLQPYEEDNWEWIKIGDVVMKNVMECVRCTIPTINSETGVRRENRQPSKTMEKYRMQSKGPFKGPVMGILLEVFQTGVISVGDTVYIGGK